MNGPDELLAKFVHGRESLTDEELATLVAAVRESPELARTLYGQLVVDDLLRQNLDEERGDFAAQMEQRLRDERSGMPGGLSSIAELLKVPRPEDAGNGEGDPSPQPEPHLDLRAHAARGLEQWRRSEERSRTRSLFAGLAVAVLAVVVFAVWWLIPRHDFGELRTDGVVHLARDAGATEVTTATRLRPGDVITVGPAASAAIVFLDGTRVELEAGARATVPLPSASDGKRLDLVEGELSASVRPQPPGRPMVFGTRTAEARVLGTALRLAVWQGWTRLDVVSGRVEFARRDGEGRVEVADEEFAIAADGSPLVAQRLAFPRATWESVVPDAAGLDAERLRALGRRIGGRGCVVRHGRLVHTWGDVSRRGPGTRASAFLRTQLLIRAVEDERLEGLDDRVVDVQPRLHDLDDGRLREMTWRQLLQSTDGYGTTDAPGTAFHLSGEKDAFLADTVVRDVLLSRWDRVDRDVLGPFVTGPISCEDGPTLNGSVAGLLEISPRDLARFGLLYLHDGRWRERRLLDRLLLAEVVATPVGNDVPKSLGDGPTLKGQRSLGDVESRDHHGSYACGWWLNGVDRDRRRMWPSAPTDTFAALADDASEALFVIPSLGLVLSYSGATPRRWEPGPGNALDLFLEDLVGSVNGRGES